MRKPLNRNVQVGSGMGLLIVAAILLTYHQAKRSAYRECVDRYEKFIAEQVAAADPNMPEDLFRAYSLEKALSKGRMRIFPPYAGWDDLLPYLGAAWAAFLIGSVMLADSLFRRRMSAVAREKES
jgi:hypothetical protein